MFNTAGSPAEDKKSLLLFVATAVGVCTAAGVYSIGWKWFASLLFCVFFLFLFLASAESALLFYVFFKTTALLFFAEVAGGVIGLNGLLNFCIIPLGLILFLLKKINIKTIPAAVPLFIFVAINFVSALFSSERLAAFRQLARIAEMFILYLLVFEVVKEKAQIKRLLLAMVFSLAVPIIYSMVQVLTKSGVLDIAYHQTFHRVVYVFTNPTEFGYYLVVCIAAVGIITVCARNMFLRLLAATILISVLIILYLTFSRRAWLAMFIATMTFSFLTAKRKTFLFMLLCASLFIFSPFVFIRLESLLKSFTGIVDPELAWAVGYWGLLLNILSPRLLFGYGTGIFRVVPEWFGPDTCPFSEYLRLAMEIGLIGLACYLWFIISLFKQTFFVYRKAGDFFFRIFSASFFALLTGWAVSTLFTEASNYQISFAFLIVLAGVTASLAYRMKLQV